MSTYLSVHDVKTISASTVFEPGNGCPPHLTIVARGRDEGARTAITLYTGDQILGDRLIEAINDISQRRAAELAAGGNSQAA